MKTLTEIQQWVAEATVEFGDPAETVGQIFARLVAADEPGDDVLARVAQKGEQLAMFLKLGQWMPVPVSVDGMQIDEAGGLAAFGLEQVCPGLWTITPSLNMPGVIHAFVIIYGVPSPAPWERRIILPHEFAAQNGRRF